MTDTSDKSTEMDCIQSPNYFEFMPDEIVLTIFSHVPRTKFYSLAKVSRQFARISGDAQFWKKVTVTDETISYSEFEQLISGPCPIAELDLTGVKVRLNKARNDKLQVNLDRLDMSRLRPDTTDWDREFFEPDFLESAVVIACRPRVLITHGATLDRHLADAIAKNSELEVLSMEYTKFNINTMHQLKNMWTSCLQLKELNIRFSTLTVYNLWTMSDVLTIKVEKLFMNHIFVKGLWSPAVPGDRVTHERFVPTLISGLIHQSKYLQQLGLSMDNLEKIKVVKEIAKLEFFEALHFCMCDFKKPNKHQSMSEIVNELPNLKRLHFALNCPLQDEANIENGKRELEYWSRKFPGKKTTITFSKLECVIGFVNDNK